MKDVSNARLLWSSLTHLKYDRMNHDTMGFTLETTVDAVLQEEMAAYAEATNDPNPRYQGDGAVMPPLLISRFVFPLIKRIMILPELRMNILRMVHATQSFRWYKPIKVGDCLAVSVKISGFEDTRAGELMTLTGQLTRDGEVVGEATAGVMVRGKKKGGPAGEKPRKETPPPRVERFRVEIPTTGDQALRYAAASGDTNFIHTNNFLAKLVGLPRTILHGLCVLAMANAAMTDKVLNGEVEKSAGIAGRFNLPTLPGQTLTLVAYEGGSDKEIPYEVLNPKGKVVIRDGVFRLA